MNLRALPYVLLFALLGLSIVCSLAINVSHADVPVASSAEEIEPLRAGDSAPRFLLETPDGDPFDFNPQALERPVVLLVFRGGWCPYCNTYLSEMGGIVPKIRELGVDVLFLSGDRAELLYDGLQEQTQADIADVNYTLLSDSDANGAIALGIAFRVPAGTLDRYRDRGIDIVDSALEKHGILPVPAVFAIDLQGKVRFAYTNVDYKVRLPAEELLATARDIAVTD